MKNYIPLALLNVVEPIIRKHLNLIGFKKEDNAYYSFYDKKNQENVFIVYIDGKAIISNLDSSKYVTKWRPTSSEDNKDRITQLNQNEVGTAFQQWVNILVE